MDESEKLLFEQRKEAEAKLIARAWEDEAFRRALVASPKETIAEALDVELPDDIEIEVVEETPSKRFLVLPQPAAGDLSDEELDNVAGGVRHYGVRDFRDAPRLPELERPTGLGNLWKKR